jgi:hypothetical protein
MSKPTLQRPRKRASVEKMSGVYRDKGEKGGKLYVPEG